MLNNIPIYWSLCSFLNTDIALVWFKIGASLHPTGVFQDFLEISMFNGPISIIHLLKTGAHCWEADVTGAKLRNIFLLFKTTWIRIWSLWLKCRKEHMHRLVYSVFVSKYFKNSLTNSETVTISFLFHPIRGLYFSQAWPNKYFWFPSNFWNALNLYIPIHWDFFFI